MTPKKIIENVQIEDRDALNKVLYVPTLKDDVIEEVITYIHNNFSTMLTNTSIADKFGFHPNYLSSLVKNSTGLPLKQYILQTKIMNAVEMLETSAFSIGEIAKKCGFYDIYHFSKYFKRIMKVSPSNFTKNN